MNIEQRSIMDTQNRRKIITVRTRILGVQRFVFMAVGVSLAIVGFYNKNNEWWILPTWLGGIIFVFSLLFFVLGRKNRVESLPDYNFDYISEFKIFCNVGKRRNRKNVINYKNYIEWKTHIDSTYNEGYRNENFYHYLVKLQRQKKHEDEMMRELLIPTELSIIPLSITGGNHNDFFFLALVFALMIPVGFLSYKSSKIKTEIDFIRDFTKEVFPQVKE